MPTPKSIDASPQPHEHFDGGLYGWDWSATTHEDHRGREAIRQAGVVPEKVDQLVKAMGADVLLPGKGLQGWTRSVQAFDSDGYRLGAVYWGGNREDVHVLATSEAAGVVRGKVLGADAGRTARVDTRVDTLLPFEELSAVCSEAAAAYGSRLTYMESSQRGESLGRTLYVGAPSSAVRVRVYEKWLESPGQYVEGCNRVEVQLRPPSKAKDRVSGWSAAETFCASRVTRGLAERLGDQAAPVNTLHVQRGTPDLDKSLAAMGAQYGKAARTWMKATGGEVGTVLDYLLGDVPAEGTVSIWDADARRPESVWFA